MIIPEWLFEEPIQNKIKKIYKPKQLTQKAKENIKLDDKQLNKDLANRMLNPYYFFDRASQFGFNISLDSHHINHANSKIVIRPNYPEFGIDVRYNKKIIRKLSIIWASLINQYEIKCQTVFSARFDKQDENNQILDETELFFNVNINHDLTESDLDKIDVKSSSEHQIQQQEMKDSGWGFDKINSMIVYFYKTGEMNGRSYVKVPLRSNAILNFEKIDNYSFTWSLLVGLNPCNINHPNRVSNYKQYFNKLKIQGFDFASGFRCSDVH